MGRTASTLLLGALLAACSASGRLPRTHGGGADASPVASRGERDPVVVAAERSMRDLRWSDAEAALERAGGIDPRALERSWVLADLWRGRCAERRAVDAVAGVARDGDPGSEVLRAHVARAPTQRLRLARRGFGSRVSGWARLEAALALEEEGGHDDATRAHALSALEEGPAFVRREALVVLGRVALDRGALSAALDVAERGAALDPEDPRFPTLRAIAATRQGRHGDAAALAGEALLAQPKSRRAARRLADALREKPGASVERALRGRLAPVLSSPGTGEAFGVAAMLAESAGERDRAIALYGRALERGASPVPLDRRLRRLLFAAGRLSEGTTLLRGAVPPETFSDPRNVRRAAWAGLDRASAAAAAVPTDAHREALAAALLEVGALEEAQAVVRAVVAPTAAGAALAARLSGHLQFEAALRDEAEEGYCRKAGDGPAGDLGSLFARMRALARRHLPPHEAAAFDSPATGMRTVPFLGGWLDTSAETTSPVVAHFRRYGRFLVLGQRTGQPPEAVLLSLASLAPRREIRTQGRTFRHDVAIGYDRELRSYLDFRGGTLSGACLPDGVWLDADASRREEHANRASLELDPQVLARLDALAADPPSADGIEGPFALDEPACVSLRLLRRYLKRRGDGWGAFRALAAHEFGHVLDIERHLPLADRLPQSAGVLLAQGLSLSNVEAFLEGRAQRAAVLDGPDPDLAMSEMTRALPLYERDPGAHERGYTDQVAAFVRHVHRHAARFPAVDPSRKIAPQLDRLTNDELRAVARAVGGIR